MAVAEPIAGAKRLAVLGRRRRSAWPVAREQRRTGILFVAVPMLLFIIFAVSITGIGQYLPVTSRTASGACMPE